MSERETRFNTVQAARELGVSAETVRTLFHAGKIPEAWQVQGRIVIPRRAVERLKRRSHPVVARMLSATLPQIGEDFPQIGGG